MGVWTNGRGCEHTSRLRLGPNPNSSVWIASSYYSINATEISRGSLEKTMEDPHYWVGLVGCVPVGVELGPNTRKL